MMFKMDKSDFQRMFGAAVGAMILASTMVAAAVGPARAVETAPGHPQADAAAADRVDA